MENQHHNNFWKTVDDPLLSRCTLRGADAIHLASALYVQKLLTNEDDHLIFVTSDLELKLAAQESHLRVIDPVEQTETDKSTENVQSDTSSNERS